MTHAVCLLLPANDEVLLYALTAFSTLRLVGVPWAGVTLQSFLIFKCNSKFIQVECMKVSKYSFNDTDRSTDLDPLMDTLLAMTYMVSLFHFSMSRNWCLFSLCSLRSVVKLQSENRTSPDAWETRIPPSLKGVTAIFQYWKKMFPFPELFSPLNMPAVLYLNVYEVMWKRKYSCFQF